MMLWPVFLRLASAKRKFLKKKRVDKSVANVFLRVFGLFRFWAPWRVPCALAGAPWSLAVVEKMLGFMLCCAAVSVSSGGIENVVRDCGAL